MKSKLNLGDSCATFIVAMVALLASPEVLSAPSSAMVSCERRSVLASTTGDVGSTTCSVIKFIGAAGTSPKIFVTNSCSAPGELTVTNPTPSSVTITGSTSGSADRCVVTLEAGDDLDHRKSGSAVTFTAYARSAASTLKAPASVSVSEGTPVAFTSQVFSLTPSVGPRQPVGGATFSCDGATSPYGEAKTCSEVSAIIDGATGVFSWTPSTESEGTWTFTVASLFPPCSPTRQRTLLRLKLESATPTLLHPST